MSIEDEINESARDAIRRLWAEMEQHNQRRREQWGPSGQSSHGAGARPEDDFRHYEFHGRRGGKQHRQEQQAREERDPRFDPLERRKKHTAGWTRREFMAAAGKSVGLLAMARIARDDMEPEVQRQMPRQLRGAVAGAHIATHRYFACWCPSTAEIVLQRERPRAGSELQVVGYLDVARHGFWGPVQEREDRPPTYVFDFDPVEDL